MLVRALFRFLAVLSFASCLCQAVAQQAEERLERLASIYEGADNWPMRSIALLGVAAEKDGRVVLLLEGGLGDEHQTVQDVAALALRDLPGEVVRAGACVEYVDRLLEEYVVSESSVIERLFAYAHLQRVAGKDYGRKLSRWKKWWSEARATYEPVALPQRPRPDQEPQERAKTETLYERILDLQADGLDLVLALDQTGSMGPYIDSVRREFTDLIGILRDILPPRKLRMGLVTYEDTAHVRVPLSDDIQAVSKKLERVTAGGGGDWPEGIDRALSEMLVNRKMTWRREAAKVVIICGDAPAHKSDRQQMYSLVEAMHTNPERIRNIRLTRKARVETKPFIVSCVHALLQEDEDDRIRRTPTGDPKKEAEQRKETADCFRQLASRGGGTYVVAKEAGEVIVQLLALSFGGQWEEQIRQLLTYLRELREYRKR